LAGRYPRHPPSPEPAANQVKLDIEACGICGTDRKVEFTVNGKSKQKWVRSGLHA
jgi:threonine dehydrogenase-like Zn-dependent dehydrogenase